MNTWSAAELLRVSGSYWTSSLLHTAVALDVFSPLAESAKTCAVLAEELKCSRRGLGMLLTALVAAGLLHNKDGAYLLSAEAKKYLCAGSPEYLGHIIRHHQHLVEGWNALTEAVQNGAPVRTRSSLTTDDALERQSFLLGMHNLARLQAERVAALMPLGTRLRLMDVGGGPGTYALTFCKQHPALEAVVFDLPTSRPFAEQLISQYGLEDRVRFMPGDFLQDTLPQGCDAAWLSQVLHGEGPEDGQKLLQRCAAVLPKGALLAVQEFMLHSDMKGPLASALFGLNMLIGTQNGCAFSEAELVCMMHKAGVGAVERLPLELPNGAGVLVGTVL